MDIYDLMKQVNDAFNQRYCFSSKRKNSKRYGLTILDNSSLSVGWRSGSRPQTAGAAPLRSWQSSRHEPAVKQLRQPLPFRGAKHFHTAAPMGWRCESAFALLSHQKVTKRLFLAEIYDKIEDGRISGKGAILWELRFRVWQVQGASGTTTAASQRRM